MWDLDNACDSWKWKAWLLNEAIFTYMNVGCQSDWQLNTEHSGSNVQLPKKLDHSTSQILRQMCLGPTAYSMCEHDWKCCNSSCEKRAQWLVLPSQSFSLHDSSINMLTTLVNIWQNTCLPAIRGSLGHGLALALPSPGRNKLLAARRIEMQPMDHWQR